MSQELKLKYYLDQKPLSNADIENMKKSKKNSVMNYFLLMKYLSLEKNIRVKLLNFWKI